VLNPRRNRPRETSVELTWVLASEVETGDLLYGNTGLEVVSVRVYDLPADSDGSPVTDALIVTKSGETHEFDGQSDLQVHRRPR